MKSVVIYLWTGNGNLNWGLPDSKTLAIAVGDGLGDQMQAGSYGTDTCFTYDGGNTYRAQCESGTGSYRNLIDIRNKEIPRYCSKENQLCGFENYDNHLPFKFACAGLPIAKAFWEKAYNRASYYVEHARDAQKIESKRRAYLNSYAW